MIKINLLGEETVIDNSSKFMLLGYVASLAVLLIVFASLQLAAVSSISVLSSDKEGLEEKLANLKKTTEEVRNLEKRKAELDRYTATIARLKLNQEGPVRVLDDLNMAVPIKAWITEISEKGSMMKVVGMAANDSEIVAFMKNLESSNYFSTVDLVESVSVALVKITALNHFNAKYTRYTVRAEEKLLQLKKVQAAARLSGLKFESTDGPPVEVVGPRAFKVMESADRNNPSGVKAGVFKRGAGRVEKISAWTSVEPVKAKAFTIMARVLYAGKLKNLLADTAEVKQVAVSDVAQSEDHKT